MRTQEPNQRVTKTGTPYPDIPVVMESKESDYNGPGIISSVAIAGHPIHPVLVVFPVAFLVGAALTDIVYWLVADPFWARASFWLIGAGLVSGIAAAVVGLFDFINIKRVRKRKAGWAHMYSNVAALVASAINLGLRLDDPAAGVLPIGVVISVTVALLLGLGGWFGGELAYRHKIAAIGPTSREQAD